MKYYYTGDIVFNKGNRVHIKGHLSNFTISYIGTRKVLRHYRMFADNIHPFDYTVAVLQS